MNPDLPALVPALCGLLLGALIAWLLLRGRAGFEREAAAALAEQKTLLAAQAGQFASLAQQLNGLALAGPAEAARLHEALLAAFSQQRLDLGGSLALSQQGVAQQTGAIAQGLSAAFEAFGARIVELRGMVEERLKELQTDNAAKLEAMRQTVDEKLHATLEARLGESFKLVSERLEQVHRGLGEMQTIATGVGDLKRVLSNVKTRGGWGEIQLGNLLEQLLTADQFASQVAVQPGSSDRVDFAIKLPGKTGQGEAPVWIPIDAKFPVEDYQRLMDAHERADAPAIETAAAALEAAVRKQARSISEKYICPPHSTDFALLYLPTEGLYAEVLRRPGLADAVQRDHRIVITGPTTISALLNSLQMGFRTLAIEQRSSEVWQVLGAVKSEFGKFGEVLSKVQDKLDQASDTIKKAGVRTRAIQRNLRDVEALPEAQAVAVLGAAGLEDEPNNL